MKNQPPRVDLTGQRFGLLTAIQWVRRNGSKRGAWECLCACGRTHDVTTKRLRNGEVKSCGCATLRFISLSSSSHGMSKTPVYGVWLAMRARCSDPSDKSFQNYGGRGISVCERWASFETFAADMGPRPSGMTLDRINNNGNYEPGNCRWSTRTEQNRNTRANRLIEHDGRTLCLSEWAELLGMKESFIRRRMKVQGMTFEEAISAPKRYSVWRRARMERQRGLDLPACANE